MTRTQQLKAINERLGQKTFRDPGEVSSMLIVDYLDKLSKRGLVEVPFAISELGSRVVAIAEEFGWSVDDEEVLSFCQEMMPEQVDAFSYLIRVVRDNKLETESE